ncbi:MAG: hypothetical protein KDD92_07955 [Caldilineaceae bacterium]|nr:hypothetical protein [Caldilineaceae bacterium]
MIIRIFQPETVLGRHRQLVKRKWTYNSKGRGGRPRIDQELERLVIRFTQENHDWGYDRIEGEYLDKIIVVNQAHLRSVLTEYVELYSARRPHQGIGQQSPIIRLPEKPEGLVQRRPVLGGLINTITISTRCCGAAG